MRSITLAVFMPINVLRNVIHGNQRRASPHPIKLGPALRGQQLHHVRVAVFPGVVDGALAERIDHIAFGPLPQQVRDDGRMALISRGAQGCSSLGIALVHTRTPFDQDSNDFEVT